MAQRRAENARSNLADNQTLLRAAGEVSLGRKSFLEPVPRRGTFVAGFELSCVSTSC